MTRHAQKAAGAPQITMADFVYLYGPILREMCISAEIDYSWVKDAIMVHDMRKPANIRTAPLYSRDEVEGRVFERASDFKRRVQQFMAEV